MLGTQAANIGGASAFMAKVAEMVCSRIYKKLNASPSPKYNPMPPFRLRADNDKPIIVRMKEAKEEAIRL